MNQTDTKKPLPFSRFEWLIAWRYLRARRAEGGISVMAWISFIGIMLAVFALIATLGITVGVSYRFHPLYPWRERSCQPVSCAPPR